jgi:hypothetical protein
VNLLAFPDLLPANTFLARLKAWRNTVKEAHAEHNLSVKTRQVRRRIQFSSAFAKISTEYGGEARFRRRSIARTIVKRLAAEKKAA